MWSAISKDFMSFANNMKEESHAVMGALSRLAADVVGEDGVYAGDNASQEAKDMPIDVDTLLKFQEDYRTYTVPLSDLEHTVFSDWASTSPFSSLHAAARQAQQTGKTTDDEALAPSPSPSQTWRDEPTDEVRQRLLDCSEAVLEKYVELVGDMVSPRMSSLRRSTAASTSPQSHPKSDATPTAATTDKPADAAFPSPSSAAAAAAAVDGTSPTFATPTPARPAGSPSGAGLLTEDDFFDRYFFRLAQLRCQVAEQRREQQQAEEEQKKQLRAQQVQKQHGAAPPASASRQVPDGVRPGPQAAGGEHDDEDDEQGRGGEDVAVPLFAKKVLSAASGFMNAMDSALIGPTNGRDPVGSDDDNVPPEMLDAGEAKTGTTAGQRRNISRAALHEQIVGLESVVQELQYELRREAARSQQLEALLRAHGITIPEPVHITPEKLQAPLVVTSTPPLAVPSVAPAESPQSLATTPASTTATTTTTAVQHVDVAVPTPSDTPPVRTSSAASVPGGAAAPPLPPTPPAFKPFTASSTPMASPPGASVGATPAAAPSPPVFSSSAAPTPMGSRSTGASPLSSKKNE